MKNKIVALTSVIALFVLGSHAWADSHSSAEVKAPEEAAEATESMEAPRLCIPREEAEAATVPSDGNAEVEAKPEEADKPEAEEAAPTEGGDEAKEETAEAEAALPICDEDGNPPAVEAEATEETAEATEEPAKTE